MEKHRIPDEGWWTDHYGPSCSARRRRADESIEVLLRRLDQAIELAQTSNTHINEINDDRNVLEFPSTRKSR